MGYYTDLFLRPKQAVAYAYANPSLIRSIGFIILGTLLGIVSTYFLVGQIIPMEILGSISGDVARWLLGGVLLILIGLVFKRIAFSGQNAMRALTLLAQLNLYGFFIFLIMGIIFPVFVIPEVLVASNQASNGVIGPEEFQQVLFETLADPSVSIIGGIIFLIAFILVLYCMYVLFLSVQKYLDTTVAKAILVMLVMIVVQSFITLLILG